MYSLFLATVIQEETGTREYDPEILLYDTEKTELKT